MTFSAQVKQELCAHTWENPCCALAFCYGAACFSHSFTPQYLEFHTESRTVARCLRTAFAARGIPLRTDSYCVHGHSKLALTAQGPDAPAQLAAYAAACGSTAARLAAGGALSGLLRCPGCRGAYLAGAFLCGGIVANPQKEYHLEFVCQRAVVLDELAALLQGQGLSPLRTRKNANLVLYLRASEQIEDLLTQMGAPHCAMAIMNEKIFKNFRNQANRATNCETANIDKTVAANQRTLEAIRLLQAHGALAGLPQPLRQAAAARLADPAATLAELAAAAQPPVSKSGLAHRLKKLEEAADALRQK